MPQSHASPSDVVTPPLGPALESSRRLKQWDLLALAGEGTWSQVYRARPAAAPDRPADYAVKVLRADHQDDPRVVALLQREAEVGRNVAHPHVVSVLAASIRRPPYFTVMPWLRGKTLKAHLASTGRLKLSEALWIARQAAAGLDALDRAHWTHGDVKPGNLFLSPEGHVTLIDLGFARRGPELQSAANRCVLGTCTHLAPEVFTSALRVDIRSDLYSLGVVLYEMLTGRLPFTAADLPQLIQQHRQSAPPPLARLTPYLPRAVTNLVHQLLSKDPLRRPDSPADLLQRLTALELEALTARLGE